MGTWLVILMAVTLIGGLIGYYITGKRAEGAATAGCLAGGGCLYVSFKIAIFVGAVLLVLLLVQWIFGVHIVDF